VRVAYLIVSHRSPGQVLRLVRALREDPDAEVVVRHDPRHSRLDDDELEPGQDYPVCPPAEINARLATTDRDAFLGMAWEHWVSTDWPILGRRAARAILHAAREERGQMRHYRRTIVPSESFFATVLMNDPAMSVSHDNRRFSSFAPGAPNPDVLTSADLARLHDSGAHFARKFDMEVDAGVLDRLDELRQRAAPR
jgi:hypothetical protein